MNSNQKIDWKLAAAIIETKASSQPHSRGLLFAVKTIWDVFYCRSSADAEAFVKRERLMLVEPDELRMMPQFARPIDWREGIELTPPSNALRDDMAIWQRIARLQIPFERASRCEEGRNWWRGLCVFQAEQGTFMLRFLESLAKLRGEYLAHKPAWTAECDWWHELWDIVENQRVLDGEAAIHSLRARIMDDD